jgi:hypothetical protein
LLQLNSYFYISGFIDRYIQMMGDAGRHFLRMVGDIENLGMGLPADDIDQCEYALAVGWIEPLAGFIQHKYFGVFHNRPRQQYHPPLAKGEKIVALFFQMA